MSIEICNSVRFGAQEMHVIGERICNIRQIVDNCTQAEFAAKYGVSVRVISDIENGNHAPSAEFLYQLRKK
jgi:transcriptional regulator with XRE-family HTH domain